MKSSPRIRQSLLIALTLVLIPMPTRGEEAPPGMPAAKAGPASFEEHLKRADEAFAQGYFRTAAPAYLECARLRPDDPRAFHVKAAVAALAVDDDAEFGRVLEFTRSLDLSKAELPLVARALWIAGLAPGPLKPVFDAPWRRLEGQLAEKLADEPVDLLLLRSLIFYRNERPDEVLQIDEALEGKSLAPAQAATRLALKSAALSVQGKAHEADQVYAAAVSLIDLKLDALKGARWEEMLIAEELRKEARRAAHRREGSPAKVPAVGTEIDSAMTIEVSHKVVATAGGEAMEPSGFEMKSAADLHLKVLEADRHGITRAAIEVREMSSEMKMKEEQPLEDQPDYAGLKGKPFTATLSGDDIQIRDSADSPFPNAVEKAANGLFGMPLAVSTHQMQLPQGKAPRPVIFDPGMGWVDFLPWRKLTKPGQTVPVGKEIASDLIKPSHDWESSGVKKAELRCLARHAVDGVDCLDLEFTIDASGSHREMFAGLPSVTTVALKARLLVEADTGWVRRFEVTNTTEQKTDGEFQEIPMTMNTTTDMRIKSTCTPRRP